MIISIVLNVSDHGLSIGFDVDVLNPHELGPACAQSAKSFDLDGISSQKFAGCGRHHGHMPVPAMAATKPRKNCHGCCMRAGHLDDQSGFHFVARLGGLDDTQGGVHPDLRYARIWKPCRSLKLKERLVHEVARNRSHRGLEPVPPRVGVALRGVGLCNIGDMAREIAKSWEGRTSRRLRKKIEMLFAHLKRILKLDRLRLRGPNGARDEFILAATAQNLRKMAKLIPMPTPAVA
jgi:hypothetical protein